MIFIQHETVCGNWNKDKLIDKNTKFAYFVYEWIDKEQKIQLPE